MSDGCYGAADYDGGDNTACEEGDGADARFFGCETFARLEVEGYVVDMAVFVSFFLRI